jgi:hypothetical protein
MVFCPAKERTDKVEDSPCHSVGRGCSFALSLQSEKAIKNFDELLWSDPARTMYLLALPGDKALLSWVAKDLFTAFNPRLNIELGTTSFSILCLGAEDSLIGVSPGRNICMTTSPIPAKP